MTQKEYEQMKEETRKETEKIVEAMHGKDGYYSIPSREKMNFFEALKAAAIRWGIVFGIFVLIILIKRDIIVFWFGEEFEEKNPLIKFFPWGR
jgi:hypothetical protein